MGVSIKNNKIRQRREGGFSLMLALIAVAVIGSAIALNLNLNNERMERERAGQTAWLVEQVSQAARLFIRDNSFSNPALWGRTPLCSAPREILVADLVPRYLSANIGIRRDATGTRFVTPLNQTVRVMAANSVINTGACSAAALNSIAPTAYVLLEPSDRTNPGAIISLAESLTERSLPVIAPRFDAAGVNTSPNCSGAPGTVQWDTGCLTAAQYNFLHPSGVFAQGHFGLPVWLTFRGDNRAIFRFPQPENPLAQTMTTDLRMAASPNINCAAADQIQIRTSDPAALAAGQPTGSMMVPSGVCPVTNDTNTADNRRDVTNVANIVMQRAIVTPQTTDSRLVGGIAAPVTETNPSLMVTGNVTVNGNVRSFANTNAFTSGATNLYGPASITVAQRDAASAAPRVRTDTTFNTSTLQADTGVVTANTGVEGPTSVSNSFTSNGAVTLNDNGGAGRGLVAGVISGSGNSLEVTQRASVFGITQVNGNTSIAGTGAPLAIATARLDAGSVTMPNGSNVTVGGDFTTGGGANINVINSVGTCYGDCPDRMVVNPPLNP